MLRRRRFDAKRITFYHKPSYAKICPWLSVCPLADMPIPILPNTLGHEVKLIFATRHQVLTAVSLVVLSEELAQMKKLKQNMSGEEQKKYVVDWKAEHEAFK